MLWALGKGGTVEVPIAVVEVAMAEGAPTVLHPVPVGVVEVAMAEGMPTVLRPVLVEVAMALALGLGEGGVAEGGLCLNSLDSSFCWRAPQNSPHHLPWANA